MVSDDEHRPAVDLRFVTQPFDGLDEDEDRDTEQQHRVDEGGQDLEAVEPERVLARRRAHRPGVTVGQLDRRQRHAETDDVGQHVPGVGEQGEGVRQEPGDRFEHEHRQAEYERNEQARLVSST